MRYLIFVLALCVSLPAMAQVEGSSRGKQALAATSCDGNPKGRYRIWVRSLRPDFQIVDFMCTLQIIKVDGKFKVKAQTHDATKCRGVGLKNANLFEVLGGTVAKNDPLQNTETISNQCFLTGKMKIQNNPTLFFDEVWISKDNQRLRGWSNFGGSDVMVESEKY